ncbi:UPF0389 protein CG9231-like [Argonauta hians]
MSSSLCCRLLGALSPSRTITGPHIGHRLNRVLGLNPQTRSKSSHFEGNPTNLKRPTNLDKRVLVWQKKYKTIEDVPEFVSIAAVNKAKDKGRVYVSLGMVAATIVGSIIMILSGRAALKRGEGVSKANMEWHRKYNEENKAAVAKPAE